MSSKYEVAMSITQKCLIMPFSFVLFLLTSCSSVVSRYPLSEPSSSPEAKKLEGIWLVEKGPLFVQFQENGVAKLASLEWDGQQFEQLEGDMIVTIGKHRRFLSVRFFEDDSLEPSYYIMEYAFSDDGHLLVWSPQLERFEAAVEEGNMEGFIEKGEFSTDVILTQPPGPLLKTLDQPEKDYFDYRKPLILKKL